mgnify:CR=1 FL=1
MIDLMNSLVGLNEKDGSFRVIIDTYNKLRPAGSYKMKYTDAWCACTVSTCALVNNMADIIPIDVSCGKMLEKAKKMGIWVENDAFVAQPGDIIMYDWDDNGYGDNMGSSDHVGLVTGVSGNVINIIEGNYSNAVMRTSRQINSRYIRGFGLPDYAAAADEEEVIVEPDEPEKPAEKPEDDQKNGPYNVELPFLTIGDTGPYVRSAQTLLIARGYDCGNRPLVGTEKADGEFGRMTEKSVGFFQSKSGLDITGDIDGKTWAALLKL